MFERFTERARRVVVLAQEEARLLNHNYIGTEHILLGLVHEGEGVAARALTELGVSLEAVRSEVEKIIGQGGSPASGGHVPFTPRAKKVLELSLREALQLGHNYIGTEHILLGLLREGEGVAAQVLTKLGAQLSTVRESVVHLLSGYTRTPEPPRETPAALDLAAHARQLAGAQPLASHHYLLGLLSDQRSVAARVLESFGVTRQAVEQKLAEVGPAGTSDESPDEAGARLMRIRVEGDRLVLEVDDGGLAAKLRQATAGAHHELAGDDPTAASFPQLFAALSRAIEDTFRRSAEGSATPRSDTARAVPPTPPQPPAPDERDR